jgi:hypothetical protein
MATTPHNSVSYGKNGQILAGAGDLIQLIGRKVIVRENHNIIQGGIIDATRT